MAGDGERQIISLGAGTDTRAFRLRAKGNGVLYHEFDFPDICAVKQRRLDSDSIRKLMGTENSLQDYYIHPLDLRALGDKEVADLEGLRTDVPTLVISECCLCYLQVEKAEEVARWFTERIKALGVILYEPIRVDDAFGQRMVQNLAARGVVMPTVQKYKTLEDQRERLLASGFCKFNLTTQGELLCCLCHCSFTDWS